MPNPPSNVKITLRQGDLVKGTVASSTPNDTSHSWTVPSNLANGNYTLRFSTTNNTVLGNSRNFKIMTCLKPATPVTPIDRPVVQKPVKKLSPGTLQPITFETYENNAIEMTPQRITIGYGSNSLIVQQGENKLINLPENSPLLNANGKLPVQVEYTLRNKTNKNYRFHVAFRYGNSFLDPEQVTFAGGQSKTVLHNVVLTPSNNTSMRIGIEATDILIDAGSNDVRPVYFNANLRVRVYAI